MTKPLTFYDLPLKARNLIYDYWGISATIVDLNYRALTVYPQNTYPDSIDVEDVLCFHDGISTMIRCEDYHTLKEYWECPWDYYYIGCEEEACRGSDYVVDVLNGWYGTRSEAPEIYKIAYNNHFRICRSSPGGFAPFFNLWTDGLRDLGTLTVRLDGEPVESIELGGEWARLEELVPLKYYSRYGKYALKEWEKLVQRLAQYIRPNHLTLYLIVNVPDVKTAEAVLKPLDQLPTLKNCGIWLNHKPMPELSALAEQTVTHLTTSSSADDIMPFRYLDLPQEIRFRILEYSDLVSTADLEWKPPLSYLGLIPDHQCSCVRELDWDMVESIGHLPNCTTGYIDPASRFSDFSWMLRSLPKHCCADADYYPRKHGSCKQPAAGFCECIFHCTHSAYTSSILPKPKTGVHPLLLVSHQVHHDAIPVFFRRNRFIVSPPGTIPARDASRYPIGLHLDRTLIPMRRVELSLFFSAMSSSVFRHIRYLEWVLPQFANLTHAPKSAYYDYLDTIEMMSHAMTLPLLTLVLNLRVSDRANIDVIYDDEPFRWPERRTYDGAIYDKILKPLCRLKGLKDCFVYLRRLRGLEHSDVKGLDRGERVFDNDEMRYERAIMGEGYDSMRRGKPWKERFERKVEERNWSDYHRHPDRVNVYGNYVNGSRCMSSSLWKGVNCYCYEGNY